MSQFDEAAFYGLGGGVSAAIIHAFPIDPAIVAALCFLPMAVEIVKEPLVRESP